MKKIFILSFLLIQMALSTTIKLPHAKVGLNYFENNNKKFLVVSFKNDDHWHTYWKNPGDAGLPTKITLQQNNKDLNLKMLEWPTPKKFMEEGNILAYGYDGEHSFFYELTDNDIKILSKEFQFEAKWLACKDICIPEKKNINAKLVGNNFIYEKEFPFEISKEKIAQHFSLIAQDSSFPNELEIYLNKDPSSDTNLALNYTLKVSDDYLKKANHNLLTPFPLIPFGFKHEKIYFDAQNKTIYGKMLIEWDGNLQEPEIEFPANGQFKNLYEFKFLFQANLNDRPVIISTKFDRFQLSGQAQLDEMYQKLSTQDQSKQLEKSSNNSILLILFYAFIGGLILNLMPCVLPVISIKLFGLISHQDESKKKILKHNLFYTLGVLSTFVALAIVITIIKSAGHQVGWGFQLQSPQFVLVMLIGIFILSLNMFGLFEFKTPFGNKLGNAELKKGVIGDFMGGVLTTILSTPCSAPFLGTALTFALTTTTANIFLTFIFIGLGLSFPFIMTAIFPGLVSFLPRPGMWMEKFKNFLGLSLILTAVWLYDVLMSLIDGQVAGIYLNTLLTLIFFAFYFHNKMSKTSLYRILVAILPLLFFVYILKNNLLTPAIDNNTSAIARNSNLDWQAWSEEKLSATQGPVFIDFTAKWCLTCKVNKKIVFESDDFSKFTKENNIQLQLADWTKYDPAITKWLEKYNVVSVPAYFIKTKNGEIKFLGETISIQKIKNAL